MCCTNHNNKQELTDVVVAIRMYR